MMPTSSPYRMTVASVRMSDYRMDVQLNDGREMSVYWGAFDALSRATPAQRENWALDDDGAAIRWPEIGQRIPVESICRASSSGRLRLRA